ncbi:MAG: polyamine aminopropyltransferase [Deltaproteobacteria bacterium]
MELWFTEEQTPALRLSCKVNKVLYSEKSEYQDIAIVDTEELGRMLALDSLVQTNIMDEFIYHEMITHIPLFTHNNPKKALVVGGGDGGAIREILKHPSIDKAVLGEIDDKVVEACKKYLPEISCGLSDKRAEVCIGDGIKYIKEHKDEFDVICIDSSEPIGPGIGLFQKDFYQSVYEALKEDGVFVAQTESPFYNKELISNVYKDVKSIFPIVRVYFAVVPTYPGGLWTFTLGSKKYDPLDVDITKLPGINTRYFTPEIFKSAFNLPKFTQDLLK